MVLMVFCMLSDHTLKVQFNMRFAISVKIEIVNNIIFAYQPLPSN